SCSSAQDPTTRCGGSRCCSACSRPSSICRSWKSRCLGLFPRRLDRHTRPMQLGPNAQQSIVKPAIASWRTPAVIVACGCLIATITYGPRSSFGFFMGPMTLDNAWGRDVFALSVAMQTLIYGIAQPFSGALADKFGTVRVMIMGALLYATGVFM